MERYPSFLASSGTSGYFNLTLPRNKTTICAEYAADAADLYDKLSAETTEMIALKTQPDKYEADIVNLQKQIDIDSNNLNSDNVLVSECDPNDPDNVTYAVPRSVLNAIYPIEVASPQLLDPEQGLISDPISGINGVDGYYRAVPIDPDIRTWVNMEIKLDAWSGESNGQTSWVCPEARAGRFGQRVGAAGTDAVLHDTGTPLQAANFCGTIPGSVYDTGDTASSGAQPQWEIDILFDGKAAASIATLVTSTDQIGLAPADARDNILNLFESDLQGFGDVDPEVGFHRFLCAYSAEAVKTVTIKAKLINYAYDVFRYGTKTQSYAQFGPDGNFTGFAPNQQPDIEAPQGRYGQDPGFYWGNNCEAICFGNVGCNFFIFGGYKLCQEDPVDPVVTNVVWEGSATFSVEASSPYSERGISVGTLFDCFFDFNLNGGVFQYDVNLRKGVGRTQQSVNCQEDGGL